MVLITELVLLTVAILVSATGALMALIVNFVLPDYFWDEAKAGYNPFPTVQGENWDEFEKKWMAVGRNPGVIESYPFLVSISSYYLDSKKHCLFLCTGALVDSSNGVAVYTGSGCHLGNHRNIVVRGSSNYFWKGGNVSKITSVRSQGGWHVMKIKDKVGAPAALDLTMVRKKIIPTDATLHSLGWGAEINPNVDIIGDDTFYEEIWGMKRDAVCRNAKSMCNYYFSSHHISSFFIEAMDDTLTCCYEGYIVHTEERDTKRAHSELTGKPLVYIDSKGKPTVIAMQYKTAVSVNETIGYYTVFRAIGPNFNEAGNTPAIDDEIEKTESGKIGDQLIVTKIYRVQNTKKYFLQWFRYSGAKFGEQFPQQWQKVENPWTNGTAEMHTEAEDELQKKRLAPTSSLT
ncbi:unnamed protein product [Acanthoscelides obtectus]|uniref:Uncharacterized protein n=1 Tax=Acanthoscelides obtectus TaxID=200917 RepID=A0A9P0L6H1_ACAOB|nr:unnamed protein product [Acanthoscelides obtectus]CAK1663127.1 hypothetical protein AOBTE_LOCUS23493 [Acanthoscelides obtectus]